MKNKILSVRFQSFDDFTTEIKQSLKSKKKNIQNKSSIYFDSIESYRKFMTLQKIEILSVIAQQSPSSIYELAKMVDRSFSAVFKDCASMESTGFIQLIESGDSKNTKKPALSFDYNLVHIDIPNRSFDISIGEAA